MGVFFLKYRDTRPILEVELHSPPPLGSAPGTVGPIHNLTGATDFKLHIHLSDGQRLVRTMVPDGNPALGLVRYTWVASDWLAAASPDADGSYASGGLVVGPSLPLIPGTREHRMEYEVLGAGGSRLTFPNDGYDTLRIIGDVGQA